MGPTSWKCLAAALCSLAAIQAAEFTTYIGESYDYHVARILTDAAGNTYVAGSRTFNIGGSLVNAFQLNDVFLKKLDAAGKTVLFATLTGKGNDVATGLALDAAGNIYVAGSTSSPDFPLRNPLQTTPGQGFIAKFTPDAGLVLYSTYFPAPIAALAVDPAGNMYVTGYTRGSGFPLTPGLPNGQTGFGVPIVTGAFFTKIAAAGDKIVYSGVLVGSDKNCGCCSSCFTSSRDAAGVAIALDPAGNAYIAGNTNTLNLPTTAGAMLARGPGAFVAKVNAAGTALDYLTYLGPGNLVLSPFSNPANTAAALTVDANGNAYIVGSTFDPKFPATTGAYQTTFHGPSDLSVPQSTPPSDAFAVKLNPTGTAAVWATYLGGTAQDSATAAALDPAGNLWITGTTASTEFPNAQGWSSGQDFVAALNPAGSALSYSARYPTGAASQAIALDPAGLLHLAGPGGTISTTAPGARTPMRLFGIVNAAWGALDGRIAAGEVVSLYGPHIGPVPPVAYPSDGSGAVAKSLGGVQVLFNDVPSPLLYVSDSQINAVVPFAVAGQSSARIRVVNNGVASPDFTATVLMTAPQIFQSPNQAAAAINQDGSINSVDHPAAPGSVVSMWVTGVYVPSGPDGQIPSAADYYACCQVYANEAMLRVTYSGAAPGIVAGVVQINFQVPADASGITYITVLSGNRVSNPAYIMVTQPLQLELAPVDHLLQREPGTDDQ
jgi:uncharacterized protein (TIGR03437 family)